MKRVLWFNVKFRGGISGPTFHKRLPDKKGECTQLSDILGLFLRGLQTDQTGVWWDPPSRGGFRGDGLDICLACPAPSWRAPGDVERVPVRPLGAGRLWPTSHHAVHTIIYPGYMSKVNAQNRRTDGQNVFSYSCSRPQPPGFSTSTPRSKSFSKKDLVLDPY